MTQRDSFYIHVQILTIAMYDQQIGAEYASLSPYQQRIMMMNQRLSPATDYLMKSVKARPSAPLRTKDKLGEA